LALVEFLNLGYALIIREQKIAQNTYIALKYIWFSLCLFYSS